ncbi:hypothetical protein ABB37_07591 [Leptomonas pyrrhocoris]|uniref:HD domain-containing protein n=1 Tax=Leptomonas pyrrhocoris TaxID=157538 RepID=A0A0M9FVE9_LEPPY|nr:hypothetical protein ABB37_07591 [Leptomonas pyrrhocoris]KPA76769.1 hypothetical protein ABB37_07591 [Leptomonas pyrrhocoris]|eukprot:XP_015655208.1 hypothetical protein ABB37_07591 [Leptomonas pyrrhocoris]
MDSLHYKLWDRCTAFVARVCAGRDASHGLAHMRKVTEQAVLLYLMDAPANVTHAERAGTLYRIILVGMLHDVADHKYDSDGTLFQQVEAFVEAEAATLLALVREDNSAVFSSPLPCSTAAADDVDAVKRLLLTALDAISYSKENKRGMRWFVPALSYGSGEASQLFAKENGTTSSNSWVSVRDYVSDSDKLEAIGEEGLLRCYEFTCARYRAAAAVAGIGKPATSRPSSDAAATALVERHVEGKLLKDVVEHFHEKLKRLLPEFMVTKTGRYLGSPRAAEMAALLVEWEAHGPPPVTVYWRNAASEYVMEE